MNYGRRQTPAVVLMVMIGVLTIGFAGAAGANSGWMDSAGADERFESDRGVDGTLLQNDQRAHVAALLGIVVLTVLGGTLAVRNRIEGRRTETETEPERREDEFVTDRERIKRLVSQNGGRMRQADIVDSVEWSKAKVSRLLADLESEDEITKLRLGRENLICLRGHEPQASKSPEGE